MKNKNSWQIPAFLSSLFFLIPWVYSALYVPRTFGTGILTDVENDYLGSAIAISEGKNPAAFRHPGILLYQIFSLFLSGSLDLISIQNALNVLYLGALLLSIIAIFLFFYVSRRIFTNEIVKTCFIPIIFLLPSTTYFMRVYGGEAFAFPLSLIVVTLGLSFFCDSTYNSEKLFYFGLLLGIACGIRFPFVGMIVSGMVGLVVKKPKERGMNGHLLVLLSLVLLVMALIPEETYRWQKLTIVTTFFVLQLILTFVKRSHVFLWFINSIAAGYLIATNQYFYKSIAAFVYEIFYILPKTPFEKWNQLNHGIQMLFVCAPFFGFLILGTVSWMIFRLFKMKLNRNLSAFIFFLVVSIFIMIMAGFTHPWMGDRAIPYGIPMRMIIFAAVPIVILFLCVEWALKSAWERRIFQFVAVLFAVLGVFSAVISLNQLKSQTVIHRKMNASIDQILQEFKSQEGREPKVFYYEIHHPVSQIHTAIRQYGRFAGEERFHYNYPNVSTSGALTDELLKEISRRDGYDLLILPVESFDQMKLKKFGKVEHHIEGFLVVNF